MHVHIEQCVTLRGVGAGGVVHIEGCGCTHCGVWVYTLRGVGVHIEDGGVHIEGCGCTY